MESRFCSSAMALRTAAHCCSQAEHGGITMNTYQPWLAYTGSSSVLLTIILLGVGIVLLNWASLVVMLVGGLIGLLYRVRVEERALVEGLGQPYRDYIAHNQALHPIYLLNDTVSMH
jgi:hypothetical protein